MTSYYVDSGSMTANHANEVDVEGLWSRGPFLIGADAAHTWMTAADFENPQFWGAYVEASYVLTGEHRPYDKTVGYARRIRPRGKWGAWEIVGRHERARAAFSKTTPACTTVS